MDSLAYPIKESRGVTQEVKKDSRVSVINAIEEHIKILHDVPHNSIVIYTDGSSKDNLAGSGAVIYHNNCELRRVFKPLQNRENNFAEIFAIYIVLIYVRDKIPSNTKCNINIHIFTDSQNTIDILTMTSSHYKYSRVLNKVLDLLSMKKSPLISRHWIPSHVSYLKARQRISITGNEMADSLATTALQSRKTRLDIKNEFYDIPCKLLHASAD